MSEASRFKDIRIPFTFEFGARENQLMRRHNNKAWIAIGANDGQEQDREGRTRPEEPEPEHENVRDVRSGRQSSIFDRISSPQTRETKKSERKLAGEDETRKEKGQVKGYLETQCFHKGLVENNHRHYFGASVFQC